jgi:Stress responsive A/B Barrel Domain
MKKIILLLSCITLSLCQLTAQNNKVPQKLLRHVVLFSFKESSTPEQIKAVTDAFAALPQKIKQIKTFEWGTNNSPENLNQGFTHCFLVSFTSEKDRAIYLPHPDHKAFVAILTPVLDKVLVIDYWAGK